MAIPVTDKKSPLEHIPTVMPDLLRSMNSLCGRHGINNQNLLVLMLIACAGGAQDAGLDAVGFLGTAGEAWRASQRLFGATSPAGPLPKPPADEEKH